ncbi:hypothetical protein LINPERHAP2_LOCUS19576 [Linum perenne]
MTQWISAASLTFLSQALDSLGVATEFSVVSIVPWLTLSGFKPSLSKLFLIFIRLIRIIALSCCVRPLRCFLPMLSLFDFFLLGFPTRPLIFLLTINGLQIWSCHLRSRTCPLS